MPPVVPRLPLSRRSLVRGAGAGAAAMAVSPAGARDAAGAPGDAAGLAMPVVSLADVEARAREVMSAAAWAFVAGGAGDQWTLHENRRAFDDLPIATHALAGVGAASVALDVQVLGHRLPHPILVAPSGLHRFVHPDAEAATSAGADRAGALYTASGASSLPLEAIAAATTGPRWFQAYLNADEGVSRDVLLRAKAAGYTAIVFTADALGPGTSDAFVRLGSPFPPAPVFGNDDPRRGGRGRFLDQKTPLTLADIGTIRSVTGLPVVVKGIMRGADAVRAVNAGAAAIQVSNHGGRQIDGVPASITVPAEVVDAVGGRVPVLVDGGIRRGIDVFRALALGAAAVALARPVLFGAAVGGASGVAGVLDHLCDELRLAMLLAGTASVAQITRASLRLPPGGGGAR